MLENALLKERPIGKNILHTHTYIHSLTHPHTRTFNHEPSPLRTHTYAYVHSLTHRYTNTHRALIHSPCSLLHRHTHTRTHTHAHTSTHSAVLIFSHTHAHNPQCAKICETIKRYLHLFALGQKDGNWNTMNAKRTDSMSMLGLGLRLITNSTSSRHSKYMQALAAMLGVGFCLDVK